MGEAPWIPRLGPGIRPAVAAVLLTLGAPADAALATEGGTITSGDATFQIVTYGAEPKADLTGVSSNLATDHLVHSGWWYRFSDDTREWPFPSPEQPETWSGDQADLNYGDLDASGRLEATEEINVWDNGNSPQRGYAIRILEVVNSTDGAVEIDLFHYVDLDLDGAAGDSAELGEYSPTRVVDVADSGGTRGSLIAKWGPGFLGGEPGDLTHRVAAYGTGLRGELNDASIDDFGNAGLPFAAGDFTVVFQFHLVIPPFNTRQAHIWILVNEDYYCNLVFGLFCDGFDSGDTSVWSYRTP